METKFASFRVTLKKLIYVFSQKSQRDVLFEELLGSIFRRKCAAELSMTLFV